MGLLTNQTGQRPRAALICLTALLCSIAWIRVLGITTLAFFDASHEARLSLPHGQWRLVLAHQRPVSNQPVAVRPSSGHQHHLGTSLLLMLARDSSPDRDHVLTLGSGDDASRTTKWEVPQRLLKAVESLPALGTATWFVLFEPVAAVLARPPPDPSECAPQVALLRSTQLLI